MTLHGKGDNFRPFTHVVDSARALEFLSNVKASPNEGKVWHVAGENLRIREVAELVAQTVPGTRIIELEQPAVFESYALDSSRLLNTGFDFRWTVFKGITNLATRYAALRP